MGEFPVGQRDALDEHRRAVDVEHRRAATHAHAADPPRVHERGELDVGARREEGGEFLVAGTPGRHHPAIIPAAGRSLRSEVPPMTRGGCHPDRVGGTGTAVGSVRAVCLWGAGTLHRAADQR
ncbi:hypothetical protein GCM10009660_01940 [Catellatospora bangladeshensis]